MRITKVYTKTGDKGQTGLVDGSRVPKSHPRIDAYGTVDELNAIIGIIRTYLSEGEIPASSFDLLDSLLYQIQNDLFNVGADLATPRNARWNGMVLVNSDSIKRLEDGIDRLNEDLPPLKEFILPGGGKVGAFFHQARTVCRRAERRVVELMSEDETVDAISMTYLNRLSDYLFVAGRWAAKTLGEKEFFWHRTP